MKKEMNYRCAGIIPARYASSRFPGKPLAMIGDKPMIRRVYEQVKKSIDLVYVATDDKRIYEAIIGFGGNAVMTSTNHLSGTDRCAEAVGIITRETGNNIDIALNIQGDEPFIRPEQIDLLVSCFADPKVEIATLVRRVDPGEDLFNPNHPKVILDSGNNAIYFSRSVIPFMRDVEPSEWSKKHTFYKHIGLYAFRSDVLKQITRLKRSSLEIAESLEQIRWIENGYRIKTAVTSWESIGIDTPADLEKARQMINNFF